MPVSDTTRPETAAMTAATPKRSTSDQLQERMERERRACALARHRDLVETLNAIQSLADGVRARLRAF